MNIRLSDQDPSKAISSPNIRQLAIEQRKSFGGPIKGLKTPEGMCLLYLRRMLSEYPQYVNKLFVWFLERPEPFQWYDPGECLLLPRGDKNKVGIMMRLEIQKERGGNGRYRYEPVEVEFSFEELDAMVEPPITKIPKEIL